jgi:hypothetical protein
METIKKRKRKVFAPLTHSVTLSCDSAFTPVTQVYDAELSEYVPDRSVIATVLRPVVTANASDGSWPDPYVNKLLADMHWYANGVDISTIASWTGKYEITQVGAERGSLVISRNVAPGEKIDLQFKAVLPDPRLGVNIPIVSSIICLSTTDKSNDSYLASLAEDARIIYRPLLDKLYHYAWRVAQGLTPASPTAEADARDGNEYERTLHFALFRGNNKVNSGYTVKLFRINNVNSMTEITTPDPIVIGMTLSTLTLDLRLLAKDDFCLKFYVSGTEVARLQFSVSLGDFPVENAEPKDACDILPTDTEIYNELIGASEGNAIEDIGAYLDITWFTDSAYKSNAQHNDGARAVIQLADTGIGSGVDDSWLEVYASIRQKGAYKVAVDSDGNVFTDSNNVPFIFR